MLLTDESWAKVEVKNNVPIKKLKKAFIVQECDAHEVDLCTAGWFIKYKNTHNSPLLGYRVRFTEKIIMKI